MSFQVKKKQTGDARSWISVTEKGRLQNVAEALVVTKQGLLHVHICILILEVDGRHLDANAPIKASSHLLKTQRLEYMYCTTTEYLILSYYTRNILEIIIL